MLITSETGEMGVISISLNDENIAALDRIQKVYGLSGRSEAVRASINAALADIRELESMDGFEANIRTQMHSHLQNHKCLEVMVVSCEGKVLSEMLKAIQAEGKADYVKFVRS